MKHVTLVAVAFACCFFSSCGDPHSHEVEYNEQGIVKAHKVGTSLISANLYRHNGRAFEPIHYHQEPQYYILYYSASW